MRGCPLQEVPPCTDSFSCGFELRQDTESTEPVLLLVLSAAQIRKRVVSDPFQGLTGQHLHSRMRGPHLQPGLIRRPSRSSGRPSVQTSPAARVTASAQAPASISATATAPCPLTCPWLAPVRRSQAGVGSVAGRHQQHRAPQHVGLAHGVDSLRSFHPPGYSYGTRLQRGAICKLRAGRPLPLSWLALTRS